MFRSSTVCDVFVQSHFDSDNKVPIPFDRIAAKGDLDRIQVIALTA